MTQAQDTDTDTDTDTDIDTDCHKNSTRNGIVNCHSHFIHGKYRDLGEQGHKTHYKQDTD